MKPMIMVSGKVVTADGSPPPEQVTIERVCGARVTAQGRTDFKGYFSVDVAQSFADDPADASGASGPGGLSVMPTGGQSHSFSPVISRLQGCDLRGVLGGFRSSSLRIPVEQLGGGTPTGTLEVGTIVLQKMSDAQGTTVSATSLNVPKDAKKAFDKGHQALAQNKLAEGQPELEKAVQIYPKYASAWIDLGWVYTQQNQLDKARNAFQQAQAADDKFVPAYVGLASLAVRESKWQEAAEQSAHATQLDGVDFPAAFYYNSLANFRLGNLEQAEKSARQAETLGVQTTFPQVNLLLGVMLANRRDYADAAEQLRSYLKAAPTAPNADKVRQQLAEVERLQATESKAAPPPPAK
jgi:Flp pilus assembly protein TadD